MRVISGLSRPVCVFAIAAVAAIGLATGARAQMKIQPADNATDPIVATVDSAPIQKSDIEDFQKSLPAQYQRLPLQMLYPALLDKLIEIKLISQQALKERLENDPDVQKRIQQIKERVVEEVYLQRMIDKQVTEDALRKRYDKYVKETPARQEISARHILVQTESEAKDVLAQLKKGADFSELAKTRSIDPTAKEQGGDLGFFTREEMVPEFSDAAFKLKDGEISPAPVKTQYGWHIIKVEAHRTSVPPFEQMHDKLAFDMSTEIKNDVVAKLRKTAKIERFNLDGSPAK